MLLTQSFRSLVLGLAGMAMIGGSAQAATVLIDFGGAGSQTDSSQDANGRSWNNITENDDLTGNPHALNSSTGASSGINLTVSNAAFVTNQVGFNGANPDGEGGGARPAVTGDAAARGYPRSATQDSLFGNTAIFSGNIVESVTLTLDGLSSSEVYDLYFFASRMGASDNREAAYAVTGSTSSTVYLNAASNSGNVISLSGVSPDANNQIKIDVAAGPNNNNGSKFFYLGVLEIVSSPIPEPASLSLLGMGSLLLLRRRRPGC